MLTIRLQRAGKRNKADFRVVLAEKTAATQKKFIEVLGSYNPHSKALGIRDEARLQYWIGQHVEISPTVYNLLVGKQIITGGKVKAFTLPKKEEKAEETAAETPETPAETEAQAEASAEETAPETPEEVPAPTEKPIEEPVQPVAESAEPAEAPAEDNQA